MHRPEINKFLQLVRGGRLIPVYRRLLSDGLTPVSALSKLDVGGPVCLFESVIGGEKVGRYSFLSSSPFAQFSATGRSVTEWVGSSCSTWESLDPIEDLGTRVRRYQAARDPLLPPFTGGAIGYAGYDVVRYVERLPNAPADDRNLPDLSFAFYDHVVVFDHVDKTMYVVAMARLDLWPDDPQQAYQDACQRIDQLVEQLTAPGPQLSYADIDTVDTGAAGGELAPFRANFTPEAFESAVRKCVEYIRAGDIFQVVISQRLEVDIQSDPLEIYRTLRVVNPSPFMFYLRTPDCTLVGSSPEIMCRVVDRTVTVRPLAGTRRRGRNEDEDQRLAEELLADPKERAEHVMLVDLGRNDVGRIARYGSVELSDVMVIERYSHVMHITSNVAAELQDGMDAFNALRACLPAGTVSGAPKVRAMEIIDELEPHRRGPYAGAVGYFDYSGNMDTCIALRTLVIQGNKAYVQAGAGIVADSQPASEYQETLNKARGLLKAIAITEKRCSSSKHATT